MLFMIFFITADHWEKDQYPFTSIGFGKWELVLPADKAPQHESILKVRVTAQ